MVNSRTRRLIRGDHLSSQVTPQSIFEERRQLLSAAGGLAGVAGAAAILGAGSLAAPALASAATPGLVKIAPLAGRASKLSIADKPVSFRDATTYNNFYEFGLDKDDPAAKAPSRLQATPWKVSVEGLVNRPQSFDVSDLMKMAPMEERISRLRCVEGWSMVIPWVGFPLSELLKRVQPQGSAKFVEFTTLADPKQMPGLSSRVIRWPFHEALRLDEAQSPLTLLTFGMYGQTLPAQSGAPVRMVVPWKYGFKSIKSIVKIRLVEAQPTTSWSLAAPNEYGFYSNVNPEVDHPRWSQATERVLGGDSLFAVRRKTERFNGYEELVGSFYAGMDLKRFY